MFWGFGFFWVWVFWGFGVVAVLCFFGRVLGRFWGCGILGSRATL